MAFINVVVVLLVYCHKILFPLKSAQLKLTVFPCTATILAGCSINLSAEGKMIDMKRSIIIYT